MRVATALRRRVGGGRSVSVKQLAYTIRVSETTIWNLLSGNKEPRAQNLLRLIDFFDASFANEILAPSGVTVTKLSDRKATDAIRKIEEGRKELAAALGTGGEE